MQAYASTEPTPRASEFRLPSAQSLVPAAPVPVKDESTGRRDVGASSSSMLASLILDALDDRDLAVLADRLVPHLSESVHREAAGHVAYTVASLAAELGVSQKAVRCAIARRELRAVKRGSRWIISADAVHAWATASDARRRTGCGRRTPAPKSAGPSLRSIVSGAASEGAHNER
jgi:excisionase family DNA binding protein